MNYLAAINIAETFKTPFSADKSLADLVVLILEGSMAIAGIILLIFLIGAGIALIGSAGKPDQAAKSVKTITSTLVGFILVFAAFLIVQLIGSIFTGDATLITTPK